MEIHIDIHPFRTNILKSHNKFAIKKVPQAYVWIRKACTKENSMNVLNYSGTVFVYEYTDRIICIEIYKTFICLFNSKKISNSASEKKNQVQKKTNMHAHKLNAHTHTHTHAHTLTHTHTHIYIYVCVCVLYIQCKNHQTLCGFWLCHLTTSNAETAILEIWGIGSTFSLPLLSDLLWLGVVVAVRVPSIGQIK